MQTLETMKLTISEVEKALAAAATCGNIGDPPGRFIDGSIEVKGISTDSRTIGKGELFFALKGGNFDGHRFVNEAFVKGAAAAVVDQDIEECRGILIKVADTLKALGDLAASFRKKFEIICVAITGSNGKTTTKDMTAACLATRFTVLKSSGNKNNLIGLPQNLFRLDETCQVGVFELGMSFPGEIGRLAQICQPGIGIFTNIGPVHLQNLGTVEAVAKAKHELAENMAENGLVIINNDDPILRTWIGKLRQKVITYGIDSTADFRAESIARTRQGFEFSLNGEKFSLRYPGRHNIYNALAAVACADSLGCEWKRLSEALSSIEPADLRSEIFQSRGITVINDCYNANPVSLKLAIETLADFPGQGRKIAVLADMLELGPREVDFHVEIGRQLDRRKIDALFAFGPLSRHYLQEFPGRPGGHYPNKTKLVEDLLKYLQQGDVVLVKGSRGMALEDVSHALRETD